MLIPPAHLTSGSVTAITQITVAFDCHRESNVSTKVVERQWHLVKLTLGRKKFNQTTVLVDSQRQLLITLANKERFILQLADRLENIRICTFTATDDTLYTYCVYSKRDVREELRAC
ncbi:hypothetical protein AVEN_174105-1 [Araneus ventricosus]|uniref:Uncharacterized protein n=1 Tax=Araneus ventricosus TaxID=182803 RepID=A0A4Y2C2I2_ARAVE|nr:hypothetical protein AVEN_174105-1 [Araneus ventricosus]